MRNVRGIRVGLALMLAPLPALVAHAEDPAVGAIEAAGRAAGQGLTLERKAKAAEEKARAAGAAWQKYQPNVVAARRKVEIAQERAKSGKKEDQDRLEAAQKNLTKIEAEHHRLFMENIAFQKQAEPLRKSSDEAIVVVDGAIAAAQQAIDGIQNRPIEKPRLQAQLDRIKKEWSKR